MIIQKKTCAIHLLTYGFLLLSLIGNNLSGQESNEIDQLTNRLRTAGYDSTRIKIQLKLFEYFFTSDTVKANAYLLNLTSVH
jgi:hypothetical protein